MKKIGWALLVALVSVPPVEAQDGNLRATIFGAGSFVAGEREFIVDDDDLMRTTFDKGGKVGLRLTADLRDEWAAEISYSFGRNDLRVRNEEPPPRPRTFDINLHQFFANASYYFAPPDQQARPFATLGVGFTRFSPTDVARDRALVDFIEGPTRIESSTKLGINIGGGFEARINDWFGVRLDLRDHIMGIPRFGLPEQPLNPGGVSYPVDGMIHNVEAGVGVIFYWGSL